MAEKDNAQAGVIAVDGENHSQRSAPVAGLQGTPGAQHGFAADG